MSGDLTNLIRQEVARALAGLHPTVGTVASYDPNAHASKITHQPDGLESGWAPHVVHTAGGTSLVTGPGVGDQAVIAYLDGDRENPVVLGYLHSDKDRAPTAASGATTLQFKGGSITVSPSGAVSISTSGGVTVSGSTVKITGTVNVN